LVDDKDKQKWRTLLHELYDYLEEKSMALEEESEQQAVNKQILMQKIAHLRELV
jgi:hypothetical protein